MKFEYTIDTLSSSEITNFVEMLGSNYADGLYDYFLNEYIRENLPENYSQNVRYVHWNPDRGYFEFEEDDQVLIELDMDGKE
jgi:hypothetical protein